MWFRKIYKKLTDRQIDRIFTVLNDKDVIEEIEKYGDIDRPSEISKILLIKFSLQFLRRFLLSYIK